jgi:predicted DNA-binding transcriptional regulator YafY
MPKQDKTYRILRMYEALNKNKPIEKAGLARMFGVSEKTVQRDIDELRAYIADGHGGATIEYDKARNEYSLVRGGKELLSSEETLALVKIVLESRAFPKDEAKLLVEKLIAQAIPEDAPFVREMIKNELFYYVQLRHGKNLFPLIWELSWTIFDQEAVKFTYKRQDGIRGERKVKPVAMMFSEFYFYLIAYLANGSHNFPAVFRVDRIENIRRTGEKFFIPHEEKFNLGEFRKRVQFMYPGPLERVTFDFKGDSIEAVLDRLPTAEIIGEKDGIYTVTAEVYGKGVDMWLRSQGDFISNVMKEKK